MRHWIIGNGASINQTPLYLLKNEITWSMNRPPCKTRYYFCMDVNEQDEHWQEAVQESLKTSHCFLWEGWQGRFEGSITWLPRCKRHHFYAADNGAKRAEAWHLPELCTAFGSMYVVMQLAVMQDATEIYLVGCDLFNGANDHYRKDYPEYVDQRGRNLIETHIHTVAKRSSPVPIYNATIGGALEVYPRRDIYEVLGKEKPHDEKEKG